MINITDMKKDVKAIIDNCALTQDVYKRQARIDGAGELRIFFRIVFPSMRATFAAAAIYAFMNSWNAYMLSLIHI